MTTTVVRSAGLAVLLVGVVAGLATLVVFDQIARHRRDLFSSHPLQRFAALGYLAGREATVDHVRLLRDFIAWEPRPLIRRRAIQILERMEHALERQSRLAAHNAAG